MKDKLDQLIDDLLVDLADLKEDSNREAQFRISSFPYCPLRRLLFTGDYQESFSSNFYTTIGTAIHENLQRWLIKGSFKEKVFSCWRIVETGEIIGPCLYRDIPKKYSNYAIQYEEITIAYNGLSGHVDLVVELLPNTYVVIDFKSTNLGLKKRQYPAGEWKNKYPASRNSIIQISCYSTLLKTLFKINVVAWCLVYIDRGDPIRNKTSFHKVLRPWNKKKHNDFLSKIDQACLNNKRLLKLNTILNTKKNYSSTARELLVKLVKNRPCTDEDSYDEWMAYGFHSYKRTKEEERRGGTKDGECVLKKQCLKGNKSCFKAVLSRL